MSRINRLLLDEYLLKANTLARAEIVEVLKAVPEGLVRQIKGRVEQLSNGNSVEEIHEYAERHAKDKLWGMF